MSMLVIYSSVRLAKVWKCYRSEHSKLILCLLNQELRRVILSSLALLGAELRLGRAPAGAEEDEMCMWVEGLRSAD